MRLARNLEITKGKSFFAPDSRKIMLFLIIPVCIVAIMLSGPSLFPIGSSSEIVYVIPQILLGVFLTLVTAPFGMVATIFRAFGVDLFYSTGIIAKAGVTLAIIATAFWWYIISCLVIFMYNRFKGRGSK